MDDTLTISECATWARHGRFPLHSHIVTRDVEALRGAARTCAAAARRFRKQGRETLVREFAFGWALSRAAVRAIERERREEVR